METNPNSNPEQVQDNNDTKPKKTVGREILEWIKSLVAALIIVGLCMNFLFMLITVQGDSMNTTLANGEKLFVSILDVKLQGRVDRNDVVICHYPNRTDKFLFFFNKPTNFVKRVVAVPGDQVYRKNGMTYVVYEENGETVTVPLEDTGMWTLTDYEPYTLGENEYFVVGDNRNNSHDSRDWKEVGPIGIEMIVGRVRAIIWPLNKIGGIPAYGER